MIVIKVGKEWELGKQAWQGYVNGYFESERHAEKFLLSKGYEKDSDEIFFKELQNGTSDIAKVTYFEKIEVNF